MKILEKKLLLEGGEILDIKDVGMNNGTIMEVKDLFFNVPARKKFLKTSSREGSLINDIVTRIALSNPNISFKYLTHGKENFTYLWKWKLKRYYKNYLWKNYK